MTLLSQHPRRPSAVETEAQFRESTPRVAARIPPSPPLPATRADPKLGRPDEVRVSAPERREHSEARAPGHADTNHQEARKPERVVPAARRQHQLSVDEHTGGADAGQREDDGLQRQGSLRWHEPAHGERRNREQHDNQHQRVNHVVGQMHKGLVLGPETQF